MKSISKILSFAALLCLLEGQLCNCLAQDQIPELSDQAVRQDQAIDQEKAQIDTDKTKLQQDQVRYGKDSQAVNDYIQKVDQHVLDAEKTRASIENEFNHEKSKFKSSPDLKKALGTPGSHLYALYSWLQKEAKMKAQASAEIGTLKLCLQRELSTIQLDQYNLDQENFSLQHDLSQIQTQKCLDADEAREDKSARYWQNRYAPQYNPGDANAAFDYGYYNPGWGYWYQVPKPYPIVRSAGIGH